MNYFYAIFLSVGLGLILTNCAGPKNDPLSTLSPLQAKDWLSKNPSAQLVDVRTPEEYAEVHIAGSKLVPLQELEGRLGEIPKDRPVLLYCHSGRRSGQALELLKKRGYLEARHLGGGIAAWKEQGLPVEMGVANPK